PVPVSVHIQDFRGAADLDLANVIQVNAASTHTSLSVSPSPAIAGQPITLSAQVATGSGAPVSEGFVPFLDNGAPIGLARLDSRGPASVTTTQLPVGSHSLSASFLGTHDFASSQSAAVPEVISANVTSQFAFTFGKISRRGRRMSQHVTITNNGAV